MKLSLTGRLLLAGSIVLSAFLGITGLILDNAFRDYATESLRERLQAETVGLVAAAVLGDDGTLRFPSNMPEARYNAINSGLYAQVISNDGRQHWQSPSMEQVNVTLPHDIAPGARLFSRLSAGGIDLYSFSLGIAFDVKRTVREGFTFSVAENLAGFNEQLSAFRHSLWGGLGGATVILLMVQALVLRWSLAPLREVAEDLAAIESGHHPLLEGNYPREMRGLTDNLNALLASQRENLDRHRHTLGDLAHSLKTPLAVLRGEMEKTPPTADLPVIIGEQVRRMSEIVDYQLQRAATSGRLPLSAPLAVGIAAQKVANSLNKVYADKDVECRIEAAEDAWFRGEEGDLLEVLGNLLDNAYKWCRGHVSLHAANDGQGALQLVVEDDGPGIGAEQADAVIRRGVRGDTASPGHGIGLAIVQDIVRVYGGSLHIGRSPALGGARLTLELPRP